MNINIRTAVIDDCERIRPLQKEIADLHHNGRPDLFKTEARYFTKEAFAERLSDSKHTIYIAETDNGEVVGYAFAWIVSYRNHSTYIDFDCFYIDDICVLKSHQRNGIGKRLFECCKQKAQEKKCKMIEQLFLQPRQVVRSPCGSASTRRTFLPCILQLYNRKWYRCSLRIILHY